MSQTGPNDEPSQQPASWLEFEDGIRRRADRDPVFGWFIVGGVHPKMGASVVVDDIAREVVVVAQLPDGRCGIGVLPNFDDPGCDDCRWLEDPPTADYCRTACPGKGLGNRVGEIRS